MLQRVQLDMGYTNPLVGNWNNTNATPVISRSRLWTCERSFAAHQHLFMEGSRKTHLYIVLSGIVGAYKVLCDGRRQFVSFAGPGELVGIEQPALYSTNAEALTNVRTKCITVADINRLVDSEPGFAHSILGLMSDELSRTRELLLSLGRQTALEKLGSFILRMAQANDLVGERTDTIYIPMKRLEIADYLGVTIETVSRQFTKMRTLQIVELQSCTKIRILDRSALMALAHGIN